MAISSVLGSSALLPAGLGFRNVLINGNMRIAQRGTSSTGITTSNYYTCDRWYMNLSSGGTWTQTQVTDAPNGFGNSLKVQCTTTNASLATTNNARIWQKIEGFNVQQLAKGTADAKPLVLTFWVKAFQTGTFICTIDDLTNNRKISASYTINASATWEKKTLYFTGDTTGALANNADASLMMTWWLAAGPSFQGLSLSTAWSSSSTLSDYANNQTNVASSTSNYFQITGVQLEQNYQPTPFEQRPIGVELALCQRYFETSYNLGTTPTTATEVGALYSGCSNTNALDSGSVRFRVPKRATPTVRTFNTFNGGSNQITEFTENPRTYITPRVITHIFIGENGYVVHGNQQLASGRFYAFHYEASAEL